MASKVFRLHTVTLILAEIIRLIVTTASVPNNYNNVNSLDQFHSLSTVGAFITLADVQLCCCTRPFSSLAMILPWNGHYATIKSEYNNDTITILISKGNNNDMQRYMAYITITMYT